MTPYFFRIRSFLSWWLDAVDEQSLHSPFFFDLYTNLLKPAVSANQFLHIEALRQKLLHDHRIISVRDLGSGGKNKKSAISKIARKSLSPRRFSAMYCALAEHFNATSIVELGTSFGINTLYLAEKRDAAVTTFEGAPAIAEIAALTFEFSSKKNIDLITGDIDKTLPLFLQKTKRVDFAFIDANHRYESTLQYVDWISKKVHEHSIIIIDDIHHSAEMQRAWKDIQKHLLVYGSADLYRCGLIFFDPSLNKQHVILQL